METRRAAIHRKMPASPRRLPITGSAHKAGVVGDAGVRAVLAALDVPAERRRAAALDPRHDLQLAQAYVAGIGSAPCRSVVAEDIRDLQRRTHVRWALCGWCVSLGAQRREAIQWAHDLADRVGGDAGVERRGIELGVSERPRAIMRTFYVIET